MQGSVYTLMTFLHTYTLLIMFFLCYYFHSVSIFCFFHFFFILSFSYFIFLSFHFILCSWNHSKEFIAAFEPAIMFSHQLNNKWRGHLKMDLSNYQFCQENSLKVTVCILSYSYKISFLPPPTSKMQFLLHLHLKGANLTFQGSYTITKKKKTDKPLENKKTNMKELRERNKWLLCNILCMEDLFFLNIHAVQKLM